MKLSEKKLERLLQLAPPTVFDFVANTYFVPTFCGPHHFFYPHECFKAGKKVTTFTHVDMADGTTKPLFNHKDLATALSARTDETFCHGKLPIHHVEKTDELIIFQYKNHCYHWNGKEIVKCYKLPPQPLNFSPDGKYGAFTRNDNLYIKNVETDEMFAITTDGKPHYGYAGVFEGNESIIKEQLEAAIRPAAVVWSPDSTMLFTYRIDERKVKPLHLIQSVPEEEPSRPILHTYKYALPGDPDCATAELFLYHIGTKALIPVLDNLQVAMTEPFNGGFRMVQWADDSSSALAYRMDKNYQNAQVFVVSVPNGETTRLFTEQTDTFLFFDFYRAKFGGDPRFDKNALRQMWYDGTTLHWISDRDGHFHVYEYDVKALSFTRQVTAGDYNVRQILRIDYEKRFMYLTAAGYEEGSSPYKMKLYCCDMDDGELTLLTGDQYEHFVQLSPDGMYIVDNYSNADEPPMVVLRDIRGKYISTVLTADVTPLEKLGISYSVPFIARDADDVNDVYGLMVMPHKFDPTKKYPVMEYYYGGNQTTNVPTNFHDFLNKGFLNSFAEMGFVVVIIDGRGTPFRSKAYHDHGHKNLAACCGMEDHVAVLKQLCQRYPFMNQDKISVWGHSGGGFATYKCMVNYPEVYKCGMASSGNHMQELYIAGWSERFMNEFDKALWASQSSELDAEKLQGPLLLIHGELDDNVHPANTMRIVQALIKANKEFDFLLMPNKHHLLSTDKYYQRKVFHFFAKNML